MSSPSRRVAGPGGRSCAVNQDVKKDGGNVGTEPRTLRKPGRSSASIIVVMFHVYFDCIVVLMFHIYLYCIIL